MDQYAYLHSCSWKYADDMRQMASYLDYNEQTIVNSLASRLVYAAFDAAKLKPFDSPIEPLHEVFDLAINFILFLAIELHHADKELTSLAFHNFLQTHPAYEHGKSPIFKRDTPQANNFLMMTYKMGTTCDTQRPYIGGNKLHLYMGPRRRFGQLREHSLRAELLQSIGLAALIKETRQARLSGPLDELTASYIHSGPFQIEMSDRIQDHLTFRIDGRILVYNSHKFDYLVLFRNCLAEYCLSINCN